jgi:hypothetical protein
MTASLDCPDCGAPLSFNPEPGQETVVCSFCNQTVVIPEEMRIPLPRRVRVEPPVEQPKKRNPLVTIFAWIGVILVILLIIGIVVPSDQPSSDTPTDTPTIDASSATAEARATGEALQPMLAQEQNWPVSFSENFMDNSHKWVTGDVRDSYITGNRTISDGTYSWNITTVQSAFDSSFPDQTDQTDFYVSVDMNLISMPDDPNADAGMVLRYNDSDQTWYYFSVNDVGQYYFGWYDGADWYNLIPETDSDAIKIGQINHLAVGVQGSQFIFLINGQMVDHFIDHNLKSGNVGVGINLPQIGQKAKVEFTNFKVQTASVKP